MIEINNLTEVKVDEILIKKAAQIVLKGESRTFCAQKVRDEFVSWRKKNINLSVAFVGPSRIKNLNRKYRAKNRVTDVLAFGENGGLNGELGEVVICLREVKKNAKRYALSFEKELINCLIHGILHLLGYNHEKPSTRAKLGAGLVPHRNEVSGAGSKRKAKEMKKKQDYYLSKIWLELKS